MNIKTPNRSWALVEFSNENVCLKPFLRLEMRCLQFMSKENSPKLLYQPVLVDFDVSPNGKGGRDLAAAHLLGSTLIQTKMLQMLLIKS